MALLFGLADLNHDFRTAIEHLEDLVIESINLLS
jgi:hypothetical protein